MAALADHLELTTGDAQAQFRILLERRPVRQGRQVTFLPVETLLCLAASFLVNHRHYGGSTAHQAPEPVPSLARLFSRSPSNVLAKMANLDGSRSHGARWDVLAGSPPPSPEPNKALPEGMQAIMAPGACPHRLLSAADSVFAVVVSLVDSSCRPLAHSHQNRRCHGAE